MKNSDMSRPLYEVDPEIANAIDNEARRQHEGLELIASENFVSEAVLEAAGKNLGDVLRVGVYLTDMQAYSAMNEVYVKHFEAPYPARTAIAVAALPLGAAVEMDAIVG